MDGKTLRWTIGTRALKDAEKDLDSFIDAAPAAAFRDRIRAILSPRYAWADQLAIERSNWYRSAYINCYLLAALVVAIALLGVFVHDIFDHNEAAMLAYKAALVLIEMLLIGLIFWIVRKGRRDRWQERWVEYRALAEMFRSVSFLAYLGEHGYIQRSHELEPASSAWFLWYLRATIRELGLPSGVLDGTYQNELLLAAEKYVIEDQLGYNRTTAASLARMHHRLHVTGDRCFILTGILLGIFFAAYAVYLLGELCAGKSLDQLLGWHHGLSSLGSVDLCGAYPWSEKLGHALLVSKSWVTLFAALLPALGAAVFGIRETGDLEGFAKRAARTADKLSELKSDIAKARRKLMLELTTATLLTTAQVLSEDVGAWQSVYGRKQLNLPG
jgi:cbb3-type cytochrome oxidase subunit 3